MPTDLIDGLRHFRDTDLDRYKVLYRRLADEGQHPRVLFIACSDSRIVPNLLTGTGPGDLFIVRTIGNIVAPPDAPGPDATAAAVEFSIQSLGIREIVVCGHSGCGAMQALYEGVPEGLAHLGPWVEQARAATLEAGRLAQCRDRSERDRLTAQRNVLLSLDRLAAHPLVAGYRRRAELILHGWYYDIGSGDVRVFNPASREFEAPSELTT